LITKKALSVWFFASASFLSILVSVVMAIRLITEGAETIVNPYLLGSIFSGITLETYLWLFVGLSLFFMALTCIIIFRKPPPDPEIVKLLLKVGGNLAALRKAQEASVTEIAEQMEYGRKVNQNFFNTAFADLKEDKKEVLDAVANQEKTVKKVRSDLMSAVTSKATEAEEKIAADLKKQETAVFGIKRLTEEASADIKDQRTELEEIRARLERLEGSIAPSQAELKSLDNPEEIKGIGPALGKELRSLGITSVGDFLIADPQLIGEKTRVSNEMAENLQAYAQLMMVPGVTSIDAELLIDAGVKSRKELSSQDLIVLSRNVRALAKIYVDQGKISNEELPIIEKIALWIRNAR
jgi:predicted flap endonuclease-1-like 5' DNA nuclease